MLALCGCARVEVRHVGAGDKSDGVHFYEPTPYLLVTDTVTPAPSGGGADKHSLTSTIIYFPDLQRHYVVNVRQGWGSVNGSVKLVNGWMLDTLGAQTDSKGPETITAVSGLLKEAAGVAARSATGQIQPGLYRIHIDENGDVKLVPQTGWALP